jgi:protein TonB
MKKLYYLFVLLLGFQFLIAQEETPIPILESELEEKNDDDCSGCLIYYTEQMPYLASCQDSTYWQNKNSSDKKMLQYIYKNLIYPSAAKSKGIEGMAVLTFLITKDGAIDLESLKVLRDPGEGCGRAALKIIHNMALALGKWVPGKQRGIAVDVRYNLPIRFKLSNANKIIHD